MLLVRCHTPGFSEEDMVITLLSSTMIRKSYHNLRFYKMRNLCLAELPHGRPSKEETALNEQRKDEGTKVRNGIGGKSEEGEFFYGIGLAMSRKRARVCYAVQL